MKQKRVFADLPEATVNKFLGRAKENGSSGKAEIERFVNQYVVGQGDTHVGIPTPPSEGDEDEFSDEGESLCSMVRACIGSGEPYATQMRGVVVAIFEKMKRET